MPAVDLDRREGVDVLSVAELLPSGARAVRLPIVSIPAVRIQSKYVASSKVAQVASSKQQVVSSK